MGLWEIIFNSLKRRKGKVFFLMMGILIGVSTVVALFALTSAMGQKVYYEIEKAGNKVLVLPHRESTSFTFGGITLASDIIFDEQELPWELIQLITDKKEELAIREIAPQKVQTVVMNGQSGILVGVNFQSELNLKPWLMYEGDIPSTNESVMVGSNVAQDLDLKIGDKVIIGAKELTIAGILAETGAQEDGIIMSKLSLSRELANSNSLSLIELVLEQNTQFEENVAKLRALLPESKVTAVKEVMEPRLEVIERFQFFTILVSIVMITVVSLIVLTTVMGSVEERVREIGIFRAIGFRKSHIKQIIIYETVFLSLISSILGAVTGFLIAIVLAPLMEQGGLLIAINLPLSIAVIVITLTVGIAASWLPAVKAANLDPSEALRHM